MPAAKRKTDLVVVDTASNSSMVPFEASKHRFTEGQTRHHRQFFSDYETVKAHIMQAIGDLSGFEVIGDNVLCAVFCRPKITPGGIIMPDKEVKEDWWQHKAVLILKLGPSAFERHRDDNQDYLTALFGSAPPPATGEWMMANANAGIQMSLLGAGGTRPEGQAFGGPFDLYAGDGWPCRLIKCDDFYMRIKEPHTVV